MERDSLNACNSRSACFYVSKENVLPCVEHVLVHVELVASSDEKLAFCGVDLLEVGTTHPCPRLVGIGVAANCKRGSETPHDGNKGGQK